MHFTTPNSAGYEERDLAEMNDCHAPDSGRFCSTGIGMTRGDALKMVRRERAYAGKMPDSPAKQMKLHLSNQMQKAAMNPQAKGFGFWEFTGEIPTPRTAKHTSAAYRIRKPSSDEAALLRKAGDDWASGRAYIDNVGNYRLRSGGAGTPTNKTRGSVAPWNKIVKRRFKSSDQFHSFATRSAPLQIRRNVLRSTSSRFV